MFESITQIETAIVYISIGLLLTTSCFSVMIIFLRYKELRHGIYGMIIGTIASEVYIGIHLLIDGVSGLVFTKEEYSNSFICILDGGCTVFFFSFWCTQNIFTMFLSFKRKVTHSQLTKFCLFLSLLISIAISIVSILVNDLGLSYTDTCFISKFDGVSYIMIIILFGFILISSLLYNIWFFKLRDTSKDRSFLNGYNYFLLITSILFSIFFVNLFLVNSGEIKSNAMHYIGSISFFVCCVYISYFRMQIEYVQIVLSSGPSSWKIINLFLFMVFCYKVKFREIKKVLNVKWITKPSSLSDSDDTIYSKILKGTDI